MVGHPTPAAGRSLNPSQAGEVEAPEPHISVTRAEMNSLKIRARSHQPIGGTEISFDSTPGPLAPGTGNNFNGLGQNGWIPYDAAIAVGPNHVVEMTNAQWAVFTKSGTLVSLTGFDTWWGTPAGVPFDPKCFYDAASGHFVMLAVSKNSTQAFHHISVSQTSDPTGPWFKYQFDATKDGATSTSNWSDFPGLGFDDNAIYLTSNQFSLSGNFFQYTKLRVFSKAQLYSGAAATFTDFVGMTNADNTYAFTLQPARSLSSTATEYLLNTRGSGGSSVTLWRVTGAPLAPVLTRQATLSVGAYTVPPDAAQPGTSTLVATNDSRTYDVVWRSGILHTAWGESFTGLAAIRYLRADTTANTVLKDITYTQAGTHYYFPAVAVDSASNVYFVFSRSSSTEYASLYQSGMTPADSSIQSSSLVKSGVGSNMTGRWGDYSGVSIDPADSLSIWVAGGWANSGNIWATRNASLTFGSGTPLPTLTTVSPNSGTQGQPVNVTLTGTNFLTGATINLSGTGITISNTNVGSSTTITATFTIAANAPLGGQNVTVTTSNGTSGAQTFTVNAPTPPPTFTSITPNNGIQGQAVPVTLAGTNLSGGTISLSGTGITVSNVVASANQITATFTIANNAPAGAQNVTVNTAGGTAGPVSFTVNLAPPTLSTITPNNGVQGAAVPVTLAGTFMTGATINLSGTGITVSNVVSSFNQITATFTIASNAPTGSRSVTVSNSAGTSTPVTFTVNAPSSGPPTLTTPVSPNAANQGATVNVTLNGTNFVSGSTTINITLGNGGVTTNNVNVISAFLMTADFIVSPSASLGDRAVTVTTPLGTSGQRVFHINAGSSLPSLSTILPNNGLQGQSVPATLTGNNLSGGTINFSGTGITASNVVTASGQITATFNIASNAPTSSQNVTVTTGAGTTGPVSFTVNPAPPTLSTITPNNGIQGAAVPVTLAGTFLTGGTINFSGTGITASSVVATANQITATFNIASNAPTGSQNITITTGAGTTGPVSFTVNPAPPTLSTITPNNGIQGTAVPVTLAGTFLTGGTINFSGTGITASNVVASSGQITATFNIAASAPTGSQNITVTTPGGTTTPVPFTVNPAPPTLSTITPNNGNQGAAVPVTLAGTFLTGGTINLSGTGISVSNVVASSNQITATFTIASNTPTGLQNVTVSTSAGTSGPVSFTVNPAPPTLASVTPNNGIQGAAVPVTLSGTFLTGGTINLSGTGITLSNVVASSNQITATFTIASNASTAAQNVTVTTAGGTTTSVSFTVNPAPPTLSTITPNNGIQGAAVPVTLAGNFLTGGTINLSGTGISVSNVVASANQITATLTIASNAPTGAQDVTVTTPGGTAGPVQFTVNAFTPAPTLGSVSPNNGIQGQAVPVTLSGTNLSGGIISLSGTGITVSNVVASANQITATFTIANNAPTGAQNVTVNTPGGTAGPVSFTVNPAPPTLSTITPNSGIQGAAVPVTLAGTFLTGGTITFGGTGITASNVVATSGQITATFTIANNAPTGAQNVTVTTPGGTTSPVSFTVNLAPPTLSSISPNNGNQGAAVPVTLAGTFLTGGTINLSGTGISVSNVVAGANQITATFTIASNAPTGAQNVTVTTAGGTTTPVSFTVNAPASGPPTLTTPLSPRSGTDGTTVHVTFNGTNFVAGSTTINISLGNGGITVTNIIVTSSTLMTADFVISSGASVGDRAVTVTTPNGTSGQRLFEVN